MMLYVRSILETARGFWRRWMLLSSWRQRHTIAVSDRLILRPLATGDGDTMRREIGDAVSLVRE